MNLSKKATDELKQLLRAEMSSSEFIKLNDEDLNEIGVTLLRLTAIVFRHSPDMRPSSPSAPLRA